MVYGIKHRLVRILKFITEYKEGHDGNSPSYREIADDCGVPNVSTVKYYLTRLERQGKIRRPPGARSIEVVGGEWRLVA